MTDFFEFFLFAGKLTYGMMLPKDVRNLIRTCFDTQPTAGAVGCGYFVALLLVPRLVGEWCARGNMT